MIQIEDKTKCCGCTACASVCPVNCITMQYDLEGFQYPVADNTRCIECNLCEKICPTHRNVEEPSAEKTYFAQNKNENARAKSTSGGIFAAMAEKVFEVHGVVYGVGYSSDMSVIHKAAQNKKELAGMLMSKYVQSELGAVFLEIKQTLGDGRPVLFVGTPCQAEGLLAFLHGEDLAKLIVCDLLCYGVPSPGLYRKWVQYIKEKYNSMVSSIYFRDKKYGYAGVNVKVELADGRVLEDCVDAKNYTRTMFSGIGLRPSCYDCPYRNCKKSSDITLGDAWSVGKYVSDMDDDRGTSSVICHTAKGEYFFNSLSDLKLAEGPEHIGAWGINKERHIRREEFFADAIGMPYEKLIDKYIPDTIKSKMANMLKPVIGKLPISRKFFKGLKKIKRLRAER